MPIPAISLVEGEGMRVAMMRIRVIFPDRGVAVADRLDQAMPIRAIRRGRGAVSRRRSSGLAGLQRKSNATEPCLVWRRSPSFLRLGARGRSAYRNPPS